MKRKSIFYTIALCTLMGTFTACADMFDVQSSSVQYEGSHELDSPSDSLYSVIGILSKLQGIADRTVLFGELRGDLVDENVNTNNDLREIINHNVSPSNQYYNYNDYYAVINNCNYFLSKVDTSLLVSNQKVMLREYAVVKAIRAWTYLQMGLVYKTVPFITEPILSVVDAEKDYPRYNFEDMCDFFIADLTPYVDVEFPNYGEINKIQSKLMFFPIRLLLGDMYLWKQDYENAYRYYTEYLYQNGYGTQRNGIEVVGINATTNDISGFSYFSSSSENLTIIPMSSSKLHGTTTNLNNIFSATDVNEGKRPVSPSYAWKELAEKQDYAFELNASTIRHLSCGDLRAYKTYGMEQWSDGTFNPNLGLQQDEWYKVDVESEYLVNSKYSDNHNLPIYTIGNVYLRLAEAINGMGGSDLAFEILKTGIAEIRIVDGVPQFALPTAENTAYAGIHARGSGSASKNDQYVLPVFDESLASKVDSVEFYFSGGYPTDDSTGIVVDSIVMIPRYHYTVEQGAVYAECGYYFHYTEVGTGKNMTRIFKIYPLNYLKEKVEDLIIDEYGLETAFEGNRFNDLMRVAIRRNNPAYLADKVARRKGEGHGRNEELFIRLSNPENWYIDKE